MPKVSVIMASYNKEKYIGRAIESVLNQTMADFEFIIVDDVSSDKSVEVIRSYPDPRIRFFQNEVNQGIAATRNLALEKAEGAYIALLDADDITTAFRLEVESAFLDKNPEISVVFGGFNEVDENDVPRETYFTPLKNPAFIKARLLVQNVIPNGTCMYRKAFVDQYGIRYRDGYLGMDDYLFWVECSLHGNITGLPDLFLYWRNISENNTHRYLYSEEFGGSRRKKFAEIQKFALERNGFSLTDAELNVYTRLLSEHHEKIEEQQDVAALWSVFKKLCRQAQGMHNANEVRRMYRKQFGMSLENSYLWDE